jgi:parallel beta-helix repeat protein
MLLVQESSKESLAKQFSPPGRDHGAKPVLAVFTTIFIALSLVLSIGLISASNHNAKAETPPLPYIIYGYTFDAVGVKLPSCALKAQDRNTMNSSTTFSDSGGYYQFDLSSLAGAYQSGDGIWLLGNNGAAIGLNKTSVTGSGGKWMNLTLSAHAPIRIDGNSDFDAMHGVSGGSGTAIDPYIIENRDISGNGIGYCIYIGNTTDSFILRNCQLHNAWLTYANDHGLTLLNVSNAGIWNNTVFSNQYYGIFVYSSNNNTIWNNTAFGNIWGIVLQYSSGNAISNNSVYNNRVAGISLDVSNNNEITNNIATSDGTAGIDLCTSSSGNRIAKNTLTASIYGLRSLGSSQYNTISNNNMFSNAYGIYLSSSGNNINVTDNNCSYNSQHGIYVMSTGSNNVVSDNICSHNGQHGILLESTSGNTLVNNTCSFNSGNGIYLSSSSSNTVSWNTCWNNNASSGEHFGILLYGSSNNIISNNSCRSNGYHGLQLQYSNNNIVDNNTCLSNRYSGICVYPGAGNTFTHNFCSNNGNGGMVVGDSSSVNYILDNTFSDQLYGISLVSSSNQVLKRNTMVNDGIYFWMSYSHDIDTSNTVNGRPVYYFKNQVGGKVPAGAGQVALANCQNMIVENQVLSMNGNGITLGSSSNNIIRNNSCTFDRVSSISLFFSNGNTIYNNTCSYGASLMLYGSSNNRVEDNLISSNDWCGIDVYYSANGNAISNNTISNNSHQGVYVYSSNNNRIWNNTFDRNNGAGDTYNPSYVQAYDGGSGNVWCSVHGYGNYWYDWTSPDANGDMIVDSPYVIGSSQDLYPRTWVTNSTLHLVYGWNLVSVPLADISYKASTLGLATGDAVCMWDSATQSYSHFYVVGISPPPQNFDIEPGIGYFIRVATETNLTLAGNHPDKYLSYSIPLNVPSGGGWVCIGLTSLDSSRHASDVASYVSGTVAKFICKFDATTGKYVSYVVGISPPPYDFHVLPGDAMWLWISSPGGTLTYSP